MVALVIIGWIGMFLALSWAVWPKQASLNVGAEDTPVARGHRPDGRRELHPSTPIRNCTDAAPRAGRLTPTGWAASRRQLREFRAELERL